MSAPAGWYPDPDDPTSQRYFDGTQWTDQRMPLGAPTPGAPVPGPPAPRPASTGNALSIGAIVCGVVALLFCPILLGPAGIVLGAIALNRQESMAKIGIGVAVGGMIGGFVIGAVFAGIG